MARRRWIVLAVFALALGLLGNDSACFKPFGEVTVGGPIVNPDVRCAPLESPLPPALAFDPVDDTLWVVDAAPLPLVPFDVDAVPPMLAKAAFALPLDSDSDGTADDPQAALGGIGFFETLVPDVPSLALVTATGQEEVLLFDPGRDELFNLQVSVPDVTPAVPDFPRLPDPGDPAVTRTALSTLACLVPVAGTLDSHGDAIDPVDPGTCDGFYTSLTSGATGEVANAIPSKLFVSVANRGAAVMGDPDPQYLPGAVLVYDVTVDAVTDEVSVEPDATTPVIYTTGFNPIDVVPYTAGGREFILVAVAGAIGAVADDPLTAAVEGGYDALTDAAIDVIDAGSLELVATIPLGRAGLAGKLAIDPSGHIAAIGSKIGSWVLAVNLTPLASLPTVPAVPGVPVILGGPGRDTTYVNGVIHDAANPLVLPRDPAGADPSACPGYTAGVAFDDAGDALYASEFCDGALAVIAVNSAARMLTFSERIALTEPIDTPQVGAPRGPGALAVRPGTPGTSFTGPELFFLLGKPAGMLCALSVATAP